MATEAHSQYLNSYCFSPAIVVTRTLLNITFVWTLPAVVLLILPKIEILGVFGVVPLRYGVSSWKNLQGL